MPVLAAFKALAARNQRSLVINPAVSPEPTPRKRRMPAGHRQWIEDSMGWLLDEFGPELLNRPILQPAELIPAGYDGTTDAARALFVRVCERMAVDAETIELRFDLNELSEQLPADLLEQRPTDQHLHDLVQGQFGLWRRTADRNLIRVSASLLEQPEVLVAVLAHEVGHEVLLGSGRLATYRIDQEALIDLFTVFAGFGIFMANAAHHSIPDGDEGRRVARFYLREHALSDSLAYYAWLREEVSLPAWQQQLDWSVRIRTISRLHKLKEAAQAQEAAQVGS
ncbi:hypothetical protein [Kribbella sp. CA-293567]|uniref:hypothetical protein n=1 Tax=Kribbella sp. CA-293567 TaxID=3002436 RepID=UPI0022DE54F9|nr:hypothetical protein [Kribbella sp. CA-293567]WBQ06878.1 hypothetical protein OX958_08790 [Kribbella sp. CA-293567]